MQFLQIGLGSMGKRRIRNLLANGVPVKHIAAFDVSPERCAAAQAEYHIATHADFETAVKVTQPDAYLVSTPPHLHAPYFLHAARAKAHLFVEVGTSDDGFAELVAHEQVLASKPRGTWQVLAPSCTYRSFTPIKQIKQLIEQGEVGQVIAFTHHMGQYLPDWHPWEDYRKFYVSRPESSACREMVVFELQWLTWLIGASVKVATGFSGHVTSLEMTADDVVVTALQAANGVLGTLMIDVAARAPVRALRILGTEGTLEWDWQARKVRIFRAQTKKWEIVRFPAEKRRRGYLTSTENMYNEEIKNYLTAIKNHQKYPYSFAEEWANLRVLKMIDHASDV